MFHEQRTDVDGLTPADLRAEYDDHLAALLADRDVAAVAEETGVEAATLTALAAGEHPAMDFRDAARVAALEPGAPDADTIVEMACEHLLLGMTTAVLDVETLAVELDLDLDAKEVQQKIERRAEMTLEEFVHVEHAIAARQR